MRSDRQERISERAYLIWVAEGRVHGKHDEHWHRAEHEIAEEELRVAAALANRAAGTAKTTRRAPTTSARAKKTASKTGATAAAPAPRRRRRTPTGSSSS
jgi:hypothetical protein